MSIVGEFERVSGELDPVLIFSGHLCVLDFKPCKFVLQLGALAREVAVLDEVLKPEAQKVLHLALHGVHGLLACISYLGHDNSLVLALLGQYLDSPVPESLRDGDTHQEMFDLLLYDLGTCVHRLGTPLWMLPGSHAVVEHVLSQLAGAQNLFLVRCGYEAAAFAAVDDAVIGIGVPRRATLPGTAKNDLYLVELIHCYQGLMLARSKHAIFRIRVPATTQLVVNESCVERIREYFVYGASGHRLATALLPRTGTEPPLVVQEIQDLIRHIVAREH